MNYKIEKFNAEEWLDLVNREDDPGATELNIRYIKNPNGPSYMAYAVTDVGKFISAQFNKGRELTPKELQDVLDQFTADITKEYALKKGTKKVGPSLLSIDDNGLTF